MGGENGGGRGERFSGTTIKDTWTKSRGWNQEREVGMAGVGGTVGGGMQTPVLEQH